MTSESESVRDMMNSLSTIKFRIDEPGSNRLLLRRQAVWLVLSTDNKDPRNIGPLKVLWKDLDGALWLETPKIDDMMSIVEREYGEKGVARFPYIERGVAPSGDFPDEIARFPRVVTMLKECEKQVVEISKKSGIPLKILYDGGVGVTTFRIGARIDSPPTDAQTLRLRVLIAAAVLREAHDAVVKVVWARWPDLLVDIP